MVHKCYISFKTEDVGYKEEIQNMSDIDIIDKSLNDPIGSDDVDYIMRKIREDYLADSTVTLFLIGNFSDENRGEYEQKFIKKEMQASLYNGENNTRNGILGIVLPMMYDDIYKGEEICSVCGKKHRIVKINDSTVIKEFSYNYHFPTTKCSWSFDDKYCVLVKWDDFINTPNVYIDMAFDKRDEPIADKIKVYPK
ncbi:MAG: TIR domain-containing protein [Bacteroidetes bacterium]|nr:TIR domain-containing protein [Bacteroidota bacterium]